MNAWSALSMLACVRGIQSSREDLRKLVSGEWDPLCREEVDDL